MKTNLTTISGFIISIFTATALLANPAVKEREKKKPFDTSQMDLSVEPSDNFYDYAVGSWVKNNPVPSEYSSWGAFQQLQNKNQEQLKEILEAASKNIHSKQGSIEQKVGDFYKTGMDVTKINLEGITQIQSELNRINDIKNISELSSEVAHMFLNTSSPLFSLGIQPDLKNSDIEIAYLYQGGLGLPNKDYYFDEDERSIAIRKEYLNYIKQMLILISYEDKVAEAASKNILALETQLAKVSRSPVELRDPNANYNPKTMEELNKLSPNMNWNLYLSTLNIVEPEKIIVGQPEFFERTSQLLKEIPINTWKDYLKFNLVVDLSPYLSTEFVNASFNFYNKFLFGTEKMLPRWKRVINASNSCMGEAVGKLYVKKHFPPSSKTKALEIVNNLKTSFEERINNLKWMSDETKTKAIEKLDTFGVKIGYPDKWTNYSKLEIKNDSYVKNYMRSRKFNIQKDISKLGKETDKEEWHMPPQVVNAYYNPLNNEIVFPAGILQPPFFNPDADDAINYGSMGVVIGHEMTHGFDDKGKQFDKNGNLNNWWTEADEEKFNTLAEKLVKQFDCYTPVKGYNVNGELTLGENIADLGGITISYNAFKKTDEYKEGKEIDGFTPSQRFFLGYAQVWRENSRKNRQLILLKTDPHSPARFRVNGPLSNFTPFYDSFSIEADSPMYKAPNDRIVIW